MGDALVLRLSINLYNHIGLLQLEPTFIELLKNIFVTDIWFKVVPEIAYDKI
jgi:hypothetical protein